MATAYFNKESWFLFLSKTQRADEKTEWLLIQPTHWIDFDFSDVPHQHTPAFSTQLLIP